MIKYKELIELMGIDFFQFNALMGFLSSFTLAYILIPKIRNVAKKKGLVAVCEERSSHEGAVPHLGGVAMFYSIMISITIFSNELLTTYPVLITALLILFFIGLMDDLLAVAPIKKLYSQLMAIFLVVFLFDLRIDHFYGILGIDEIPYWISVFFTFFVFQLIINAYNLIDGIDGLAGSIGVISGFVYAFVFYKEQEYAMVVLALAQSGSLLAFLRYNLSQDKKIFMGDTGTMVIGFILSFMTVRFLNTARCPHFGLFSAPIISVVILAYPLVDTFLIVIHRILSGRSPFSADNNHIHHRLLRLGLSHKETTLLISCHSIGLLAVFYPLRYLGNHELIGLFIGLSSLSYAFLLVAEKRNLNKKG